MLLPLSLPLVCPSFLFSPMSFRQKLAQIAQDQPNSHSNFLITQISFHSLNSCAKLSFSSAFPMGLFEGCVSSP